ncbi:FAD linked oxidase [Neofusicoccum parvum]|nr:FAD linked oxidase [Neofusicoccum parvum]
MKYGLVPPVVMEFPGITVGGGYSGTSGESSSFKYGFFDRTINWVEMVLANGDVVKCSRTQNADLFHGAAGAAGSLGTTTLVELQLKVAKKFVETTYHPVCSTAEAIKKCGDFIQDTTLEYVDGILFSKTQGAIITGRLTDDCPDSVPIQCFSDSKDPWFHFHVQKRISDADGPVTEAIPLAEYLFRYDRGGFWVGQAAFDYFNFPFNDFTRWWFDDILHTRMLYIALHASGQSKQYVVQDLALPFGTAEQFIDYTNETFDIWPLWLCPLKQSPSPTLHPHSLSANETDGKPPLPMLNIGLWGKGPANHDKFVTLNRNLEDKLHELGGMKWLYAHTYYDEEDFWKDFDRQWYQSLREKYGATSLPSLYEKVKVDVEAEKREIASSWPDYIRETWPIGGIWALMKANKSGLHVHARNASWKARR